MKIKALWGFKGDPATVGNEDGRVLAGTVLTVDDAYGHHLIGAKLAKPHGEEAVSAYKARAALSGVDPDALAEAQADLRKREDQLKASLSDLDARKSDFDTAAQHLANREADFAAREGALADREAEIERREAELDKATDDSGGSAGSKPGKGPKSTKPAAPDENK
jgi:hypothetical protein